MARLGRKSQTLPRTWDIIRGAVKDKLPGNKTFYQPLEELIAKGPMSYGTASKNLTLLEEHKYIKKHTNGTIRLIYIDVLRMDNLGEDILGKKEERPKLSINTRINTAKPKNSTTETLAQAPIKNARNNDVVLFLDYENLKHRLQEANTTMKSSELITKARSYGRVVLSMAFVPPKTHPEIQMRLRIEGFRIMSCPPRKTMGKDTCDQSIEEFARFCLEQTNIKTFVIVSGDGDFIDILGEIENNGRKCVVFHYDYAKTSKTLISTAGDVVNLAEDTQAKPVHPIQLPVQTVQPALHVNGANPYNAMLSELRDTGTVINKNDIRWVFLKAVILCLRDKYIASENTLPRKSLTDLKLAVWLEVHKNFHEKLTQDEDCRQALGELRRFNILKSRPAEQGNPRIPCYVFNQNHDLVRRISNM